MKLITFGDSWVWGDELLEEKEFTPVNNTSSALSHEYNTFKHTNNIGGVVNKNHKFDDYINYATNGGSNQHIIYDLMNYMNSEDYNTNDLILVGLTSPMRHIIYSNVSKGPLTWPGWDYDSYMSYGDPSLPGNVDFENWWKSHIKVNINKRNDILSYTQSCLSIKALLSNHKKYLVWQSIDGNFWEPEEGFTEVYLEKYTTKSPESNLIIGDTHNFILKKENLKKELARGTVESQIWINLEQQDWKSWLEENYDHDEVFVWSSNHPNTDGILVWYETVLKQKILKIIKKNLI